MDDIIISKKCELHNLTVPSPNEETITPKIFVACKAAYDLGFFRGNWIEVAHDLEVVRESINRVLQNSPVPNSKDWIILQYEGFGSLHLGPHEDVEEIRKKAVLIAKFGNLGVELLTYYGGNSEDVADALENRYQGVYEDELEFAMQLFDDCYANALPDSLKCYVDYGSFQRDIFINDYLAIKVDHNVHVFLRY